MTTSASVTRPPLAHRIAREWAMAGGRGPLTVWRVAARLSRLPDPGLVRLGGGLIQSFDPDDYISTRIYRGVYERAETALLGKLIRAGDLTIDVGANIGYHTALLSAMVGPSGRVIAFEPLQRCLDALRSVVDCLPNRNATIYPTAVGASSTTGTLVDLGGETHSGLSTLRASTGDADGEARVEVPIVALDEVPEIRDATTIGLLKIDVEGYEAEVLRGAGTLLTDGRVRHAVIEISPQFGSTDYAVDQLRALGDRYRGYEIVDEGTIWRHAHLRPLSPEQLGERTSQFNLLLTREDSIQDVASLVSAPRR